MAILCSLEGRPNPPFPKKKNTKKFVVYLNGIRYLTKIRDLTYLRKFFKIFQVAHGEFSKLIAIDDIIVRVET
jgi:hypothetical protein